MSPTKCQQKVVYELKSHPVYCAERKLIYRSPPVVDCLRRVELIVLRRSSTLGLASRILYGFVARMRSVNFYTLNSVEADRDEVLISNNWLGCSVDQGGISWGFSCPTILLCLFQSDSLSSLMSRWQVKQTEVKWTWYQLNNMCMPIEQMCLCN